MDYLLDRYIPENDLNLIQIKAHFIILTCTSTFIIYPKSTYRKALNKRPGLISENLHSGPGLLADLYRINVDKSIKNRV